MNRGYVAAIGSGCSVGILLHLGLVYALVGTATLLALAGVARGAVSIVPVGVVVLLPLGEAVTRSVGPLVISPQKALAAMGALVAVASIGERNQISGAIRALRDSITRGAVRHIAMGSVLIAVSWAPRVADSAQAPSQVASLLSNIALAWLVAVYWQLVPSPRRRLVALAAGGMTTIVGVLAIAGTATRVAPTVASNSSTARLSGSLGNPNDWAGLLLVVIVLLWVFGTSSTHRTSNRAAVVLIGVLVIQLLLTYSRGGLLGLGFLGLGAVVSMRRRHLRLLVAPLLLLTVLSAPVIIPKAVGLAGGDQRAAELRIADLAGQRSGDQVFRSRARESRLASYEEAVGHIAANPIGSGYGSYREVITPEGSVPITVHNWILGLGVEGGWIGLAGALALVAGIAGAARRGPAGGLPARLALGATAVMVFGLSSNILYRQYFWILVGLVVAVSAERMQRAGERPEDLGSVRSGRSMTMGWRERLS